MDGPRVEKWLRVFGTWGFVAIYPDLVASSFVYRIVQALFYSVFGLVIAKSLRSRLTYGGVLRVTVVALTPAVLAKTLLWNDLGFPFSWVLYFLIAIGYLAFGLTSNATAPVAKSGPTADTSVS